jgi:integrase
MYGLLGEWRDDLKGRDMRSLRLMDLKEIVNRRKTCKQHRIIAIKSFCGWLRKERGLLTTATDPTLDLAVPQGDPEKFKRRKWLEVARVQAAAEHLPDRYRDVLILLAATGMHVTELARFARDDASELVKGVPPTLAVLITRHKSGDATRIPLTHPEHVAAAERIRARRSVPRFLNRTFKEACRAAKVEEFTPGVLRHSVATWAKNSGATIEQIAEFLGHKDKKTTAQYYVDTAEPTVAIPVPVLKLVRG